MDYYQESYFGPAVGPLKINEDSIIVIANNETNQYGTTKLGKKKFICKSLSVYTTAHKGLFYRVSTDSRRYSTSLYFILLLVGSFKNNQNIFRVELKPLTPINVKMGTEIFVLSQFIHHKLTKNMEEMYQNEVFRNCKADEDRLKMSLALLRENPHSTTLLGIINVIFCIGLKI